MNAKRIFAFVVFIACLPVFAESLSLQERISCRQAIEKIYWSHQLWPKENRNPKPPLEEVLSEATLREKVEDTQLKSNALEYFWGRPLEGKQLQAEMERMAAQTRNPEMLHELWSALNNDPEMISECMAQPILADRLIRNWYGTDERFHGPLKEKILAELASATHSGNLRALSGNYSETTFVRSEKPPESNDASVLALGATEWNEEIARLQNALHTNTALTGRISALQEDADRFYVLALIEKSPDFMVVAETSWSKTTFEEWWKGARKEALRISIETPFPFHLPEIGASCKDDTWSSTPAPPVESGGHTAVWTGTEMIVWGGFHSGNLTNIGGRYNPATDTWAPVSPVGAPLTKSLHTAIWTGSEMIVWGGEESGEDTNLGARYNPVTDTWTLISKQNAPEPRSSHTAVWTGSEMIVWGGTHYDYQGNITNYLNSGGRYSPFEDRWLALPLTGAPAGRSAHSAVWTGTDMIVWGGAHDGNPGQIKLFHDGARFVRSLNKWFKISDLHAPTARAGHSGVWTGSQMIVWGGLNLSTGTGIGTGAIYTPNINSWRPIPTAGAPTSRYFASTVWTGTEMVVWGGLFSNPSQRRNAITDVQSTDLPITGGRFDPNTGKWKSLSTMNAPSGRYFHSTIWTGSEMIVWGGIRPSAPNYINSGGRYDVANDSWIPTQNFSTPYSRWGHSAVWTGTEMIIWGGISGDSKAGGKFDPTLNIWTPTTTASAPVGAYAHTAIWTGIEMIVWGGIINSHPGNQGAEYNPIADRWHSIGVDSNTPSERRDHSAVWTGSEMIVWGGFSSGDTFLNDGGRYDPVARTWSPTSTVNAPDPRKSHTSIWTGSEMIVWGGYPFNSTGGRYDPVQDTWQPTAVDANTPALRQMHSAVWTGSEMIVWGGWDDSVGLNSGSRYNPVLDTWALVSTTNAPEGRVPYAITWTGSEMIVWGGDLPFSGLLMNTGGRYNPSLDTWTATSTTNVPAGRRNHTAIWTGTEMIIWGGIGGANTGGLYCTSPI